MRINDAKEIVCSPGRNFVTLKIATEEGFSSLGDATLNGRELAVASYLTDHVLPLLIGRDPSKSKIDGSTCIRAHIGVGEQSRWPLSAQSIPRCGTSAPKISIVSCNVSRLSIFGDDIPTAG